MGSEIQDRKIEDLKESAEILKCSSSRIEDLLPRVSPASDFLERYMGMPDGNTKVSLKCVKRDRECSPCARRVGRRWPHKLAIAMHTGSSHAPKTSGAKDAPDHVSLPMISEPWDLLGIFVQVNESAQRFASSGDAFDGARRLTRLYGNPPPQRGRSRFVGPA